MFGMRRDIFDRLIDSKRNIIVSGDISSGKTSNIIFPLIDRMISYGDNYLFLDSKEEYINKYYGYLKSNDYNIIIINLQESDRSDGFNFLTYPYRLYKSGDKDRAYEYLEGIANNIFLANNKDNSFCNLCCCDLFIGLSLILFKEALEEEININSVNDLIDSRELRNYVEVLDKNSSIYSCLSGTLFAPGETRNSIISTFRQQLRKIISKEKLNNMLFKTTFNYDDFNKDRNAIFVISRDDNSDANVIASIFCEQLFKIIFDNNLEYKYNMVLDNIDTIDNINNLSGMLSAGIVRNIRFIIGTRYLDLFNNKYGEYINKLSNILSINNKYVEAMVDNKYEKIRYSISNYNFSKDIINYPFISKNDIKVFSFDKKNSKDNKDSNVNKRDEFVNINPFINKQDDNIFSVYEGNRNNNNDDISDINFEFENDDIKNNNIDKINKKISEIEILSSDGDNVDEFVTTDELLRMIDDRILEISDDNQDDKISDDVFPKISNDSVEEDDIDYNIRIKNRLTHYKDYDKISDEIDKELEELGFIRIIDGNKYYMNGYKKNKEKLLKEKYNVNKDRNRIF